MTFHVGQKVVCVDDVFISERWTPVPNKPLHGRIYIIRAFQDEHYFSGVLLEEVRNARRDWVFTGFREMSFPVDRFRPVVSRTTDISVFRALLNPSKQGVDA